MTATELARPARLPAVFIVGLLLAGCGERNTYVSPPPADVTVQKPISRRVTLYTEQTGSTAASKKVDLVARVQGFLDTISYIDGQRVKKDQLLFGIEKAPYETSLAIATAAQAQQEALLAQADADLGRQTQLNQRQIASEAKFDDSRAKRNSAAAALDQAKGQVQQATINLGYTEIKAPFDGIVSARLVDAGSLVGAGGATKLATILQLDPIYVNFNINEQQVLLVRQQLRQQGLTIKDVGPIPVEIGLQTDNGFPYKGRIDYIAPDMDPNTGTLSVRAVLDNKDSAFLPGLFVRVRIATQTDVSSLLVPDTSLGNDQQGRYVLVVGEKDIVEQRTVEVGDLVEGGLRVVKRGLTPEDRVIVAGMQRAVPGSPVTPRDTVASPAPAAGIAQKAKP